MLHRVDRILFRVPNVESAVRYYRDVLGLTVLKQEPRLASFALRDAATELVLHSDDDLPANLTYFLVDDVRKMYDKREALNLHFLSTPAPGTRGYRADIRDPFGNVLSILDRTTDASQQVEDGKAPGTLFAGVETRSTTKRDLLVQLYEKIGRTADDLPYTPHFESLYSAYVQLHSDPKPKRAEVWRHLLNLRKKKGILPKLGKARSNPPELTDEQRNELLRLLGDDIGKRDRLPYTLRFNAVVDAFNRKQARPLSPHLVWRALATLAK